MANQLVSGCMLQASRKASGMTQAEMGESLGYSTVTISGWEQDPSGMTLTQLRNWNSKLTKEGREIVEKMTSDFLAID